MIYICFPSTFLIGVQSAFNYFSCLEFTSGLYRHFCAAFMCKQSKNYNFYEHWYCIAKQRVLRHCRYGWHVDVLSNRRL